MATRTTDPDPGLPAAAGTAQDGERDRLEQQLAEANARLQAQAEDLGAARKEIRAQAEELAATRQDLQRQTEAALHTANQQLRAQAAELEAANERLQAQQAELLAANSDVSHARADVKRRTDELRQQAILLEHAPVLVRDLEDRIILWNAGMETLYGFTHGEALGNVTHTLMQTEHPRSVSEIRASILSEGRWEGELRHRRKDGAWVTVKSLQLLHTDTSGTPSAIVEVNSDITDRKRNEDQIRQANEALRQADRHKDEFLGMLGHELRNPLTVIAGAAQLLKARGLADPALERARDAADRQVRHMSRLVDDLLDVARVTQGKITLHKEQIDLAAVVEGAIEAATSVIDRSQHRLFVAAHGESITINGDPVRLAQVIGNLLTNAAKYTTPGGDIRVSIERDGDKAVIRVRDNGSGIAPDLLPRVFDLFVQGERGLDRSEGGLGIGLTLVRSLVQMHGGRVEAHSDGPGQGSEFVVTLPAAAKQNKERDVVTQGVTPRRILVVDDNIDGAEVLAMVLEIDGHEVQTANSGQDALEKAARMLPEVILLDLGMPDMDGCEVARCLRQNPSLTAALLVAVTGYGRDEDRDQSREAGFDHHLVKPLDMDALKQVLAKK